MTLSDKEICQRYLAGESQSGISRSDGRTQGSIRKALVRNRVTLRNPTEEYRKGGRIGGQMAVDSGQIIELGKQNNLWLIHRQEWGSIGGKETAMRGKFNLKPSLESRSAGGKTAGKLAVKTGQLANARLVGQLKKQGTKPEIIVKSVLDREGIRYEHQFDLNGKFLCDFYLPDYNIIIEVDGCYWHKCSDCGFGNGRSRDRSRNAYIEACGYLLVIIPEHLLSV